MFNFYWKLVVHFYPSIVDTLLIDYQVSNWSLKIIFLSHIECMNLWVCLKHF